MVTIVARKWEELDVLNVSPKVVNHAEGRLIQFSGLIL